MFEIYSDEEISLPLNQFANIRIDNKYTDPYTYLLEIYVGGSRVKKIKYFSDSLTPISNVQVYRPSSYRDAPHAVIKDFVYGAQPKQPPSTEEGM